MPTIFVKDYGKDVDFPDSMSSQEIESALQKLYPPKDDRSFMEKAASALTMGHIGGEAGPQAEVQFSPSGQMTKRDVPTGDPGFFNDPVTALAMGAVGGVQAGMKAVANPILAGLKAGSREALGWGTAGLSEVPGMAIKGGVAAAKGIKSVLAKDMAPKVAKAAAPGVKAAPGVVEQAAEQVRPPAPGFVDQFAEAPIASPLDTMIPEIKGGMSQEVPKFAEGSSINLERLNTTEDVKQFINSRTAEMETQIGKRPLTMDEVRAQSEALGWSGEDAVKAFNKKGSMTAAEMDATRQLNLNSVSSLFDKIKSIPAGATQLTPEIRAEFLDAMDLVKTTSQASSEAGRALNIHKRILTQDPSFTPEKNLMADAMKKLDGRGAKMTDDLILKMKDLDYNNPAAVNKFIADVTTPRWKKATSAMHELYLNALLSNPLTHVVNTTSNALTLAYSVPERLLGSGIEAISAKLTGRPIEHHMGETIQEVFAASKGLMDGIKRFTDVMKNGEAVSKLDPNRVSFIPESVNKFLPTRALSAEDAFFKGFIENSELNRLAYRDAVNKGLKGQAMTDHIANTLAAPSMDMIEQATKRGTYLTYQQQLGSAASTLMKLRDKVPGLDYLFPFVKTPTNIFKFAMERTPLNFPRLAYKAVKGELSNGALSEQLAKPLMGTALATTVYQLAQQGSITGGPPKEKNARDELLATGWQPYSVKIGDKYYSYQRLEPLASIVGMAADMGTVMQKATEDEKYKTGYAVWHAFVNNLTNKTFMSTVGNLINSITDPERYLPQWVNSTVASVIPSVAGGVARAIDPYTREAKTPLDALQSRIPGISENLPVKLSVWGNPVERPGNAVERFLSPVAISERKGSPIEQEMTKLKFDVGYPSRKIGDVELEPAEYWEMVAKARKPAQQMLDMFVQSDGWKSMSEYQKEHQIKSVVNRFQDQTHKEMVLKLYQEGRLKPKTEKEMMFIYNALK